MFQQVNLYQPIFRAEQKLFSATTIFTGLGMVTVGLGLIAIFSWWRVSALDRQLKDVKSLEVSHQHLLDRTDSVLAAGENRVVLTNRLKVMAVDLERRQQALHYLKSGAVGGRSGFSARMEALARQQLDGLWLTGATLTSQSGEIALSGSALSADLVPIYLDRLAHEPVLSGTRLELFEIRQPKTPQLGQERGPERGQVDFSVSSPNKIAAKDSRVAQVTNSQAANSGAAP